MNKPKHAIMLHECWILYADQHPVGVYLNKQTAVIERLRLSKEQCESTIPENGKLSFTLSEPIAFMD